MKTNCSKKATDNIKLRSHSSVIFAKLTKLSLNEPKQSKKHCPQDQACFHCCQCWLKHKSEYQKRLKTYSIKINNQTKQNQLLKSCIQKLTKQNIQLKIFKKANSDLSTIKENMKAQLQKAIDEQTKIKLIIKDQKISTLILEIQQKDILIQRHKSQKNELNQQIQQLKVKLNKISEQLKENQLKLQQQQKQNHRIALQLQNMVDKNKQLQNRLQILNKGLTQKSQNINKLKSTIDHSQKLLSQQISLTAQKDYEKNALNLETKNKTQTIQNLSKTYAENRISIEILSKQKVKLNSLVNSLMDELNQTDRHKSLLQIALDDAQLIARQKSLSLQNLKFDVGMLKYTL